MVAHSSVQASHGSSPAILPLRADQKQIDHQANGPGRLKEVRRYVEIKFHNSQPRPG